MYGFEKRAAEKFVKGIAGHFAMMGCETTALHKLEEKIVLSQSLLSVLGVDQCKDADRNRLNMINYGRTPKGRLLQDINWLVGYVQRGHSLSNHLFSLRRMVAGRNLRRRLYVLDDIYVGGRACNTLESLLLVQNILRTQRILDRISNLWEVKYGTYDSYVQKYYFIKYLLLEAIDLVQDCKLASLALENIKFDLERQVP